MAGIFSIIKYKLFGKKIKIDIQDAANILLDQMFDLAMNDFMTEIQEIASSAKVNLNEDDLDAIRGAVLITTFWICIHALEHDGQSFKKALYYGFLNKMGKLNVDQAVLEESIQSHFINYNNVWEDWEKSHTNPVFGYEILYGIFNSGLPDERFLDPLLSFQITNSVTAWIMAICEFKKQLDHMYELEIVHQ